MVNLTIRNIPEAIMNKLRKRSAAERRSLNSEVLVLLEKGLIGYAPQEEFEQVTVEAQADLWQMLSGQWDDPRSAAEIASEIISTRTRGREVDL